MNTSTIQTLYKSELDYPADSVEWCPHSPNQNVFVCANYYLNEEIKLRQGRILLYSISLENGLILEKTLLTDGVLDQKWCLNQIEGISCLGVVNAKNTIDIYKLSSNDGKDLTLYTSYKFNCDDEKETLLLSLDWSTGKYDSDKPEIACSDSKGQVHLLQFNGINITLVRSVKTHDFEAWITAFYYWDTNVYFSGKTSVKNYILSYQIIAFVKGGDDCLFYKYDRRVGEQPIAKNRSHDAGVTCMHSNKKEEHLLATGSYDTHLRLWDLRYMKGPQKSLETPGTMWRIKWDPFKYKQMIIACMLGGVHIVDYTAESLKVVHSYDEHKNIAYGTDWCHMPENELKQFDEDAKYIIGSCSFYDKLLCISIIK